MSEIDWELLHRYLSGECAADECRRVEAWRDAVPDRQILLASLLEATGQPPALPLFTDRDRQETWARLEREIGAVALPEAPIPNSLPRPPRFVLSMPRRSPARIAAALALIAGGVVAGGLLWRDRESVLTMATAMRERTLQSPRGRHAMFQLVDGTRVILGPESELHYAADYGRDRREVRVEGEAYFAVAHDERRPFVVRAGDLIAQDLGTEFVVRAHPENRHARVVVREGEVGIRAANAPDATVRVLTRGQLGRLTEQGEPVVETVELDPYFAWIEGRLVLDGMALREALPRLGRWLDLDVQLADSTLGDIPITMTLDQEPTPEVLRNVAAALGLVYARHGQTIVFGRPPVRH